MAEAKIRYEMNEDGSVSRLQEISKIGDVASLEVQKALLVAQTAVFDSLKDLSVLQLQAAHTLWEKNREYLPKGVLTVAQAIENISAARKAEVDAMEAAIKG